MIDELLAISGKMRARKAILMTQSLSLKIKRKIWSQIFGERSWVSRNEGLRGRERFGLVDRQNYLYGMLRAADCAKYFGKTSVTAFEFGVASGAGILNMIS